MQNNIIKFTAYMKWVEDSQKYFMIREDSKKFIMHFYDCESITKLFPNLTKDYAKKYIVLIKEHVEGDE